MKSFYPRLRLFFKVSIILLSVSHSANAEELSADANTLLLLHFNGNAFGVEGEMPVNILNVNYEAGIHGQGIYLGTNNLLEYARAGNIDEQTGTLEFWIKSEWDDTEIVSHPFLHYGLNGGILLYKYGGPWLTARFNLLGGNGETILWGYTKNSWGAGAWHHVAISWDNTIVRWYLDGTIIGETATVAPLPLIGSANFRLGSNHYSEFAEAVFDEVRISNVVRTEAEIFQSFLAGQSLNDLIIEPATVHMRPTWRKIPLVSVSTNFGPQNVPPSVLSWTSSDPSVAYIDDEGYIRALTAGTTTVRGSIGGFSDAIEVTVMDPVMSPVYETIDPFLTTPAANAIVEIPVVILRFLPTADGVTLDVTQAPDFWSLGPISLSDLKARIDAFDKRVKFNVEEGTKFHGYKTSDARPYLGYRVVEYITIYEAVPPGKIRGYQNGYPVYISDFHSIFERFNMEHYINDLGVKEVWIWNSEFNADFPSVQNNFELFDPEDFRGGWESNMSSPTTGDISNSNRDNSDLPLYDHTYIVYEQNFRRSQAEAVHNRGHQFEAMLGHINWLQDGNTDLFWKKFVGQDANSQFVTGRCGWTHMPPNTTVGYDYLNPTVVASDIEDWQPDGGGQMKLVSVDTWAGQDYAWPGALNFAQKTESQWYLYWMQNFPGHLNRIPYGENVLSNWWKFIADWDRVINDGLGLYRAPLPALLVKPVVFLQGAYDASSGRMKDDLRAGSLLPLTEPYTGLGYTHTGGGGETVQQAVLDLSGPDAVVDWVFLELRDQIDFSVVLSTRSALLQRDGDVVDVDGFSPVFFSNLIADDYYLVVKHRNHLGVMTATPISLSAVAVEVNFTTDLNQTFGGANGIAALEGNRFGLFSGDFNYNGQVQNTDFAGMVLTLGTAGYQAGDFDLNGQVQNTDLQLKLVPNIGRGASFPD